MKKYLSEGIAIGLLLGVHGLFAQTPASNEFKTADDSIVELSPFVVKSDNDQRYQAKSSMSGSRVNIDLVKLPQNISVLTEDFIKDVGALSVEDAAIYAPGVNKASFWGDEFNLRGFSAGSTKRNGVEFPGRFPFDTALVSRIEVVKGPSGVLYGPGSPGGTVNIITKKPLRYASTELKVSAGDYEYFRSEIDTTGPIDEAGKLLYRIIGVYQNYNHTTEFGHRETQVLSPQLTWNLSKSTSLTVSYDYHKIPKMISWDERLPQIRKVLPAPRADDPNRTANIVIGYIPGLGDNYNVAGPNALRTQKSDFTEITLLHSFNEALSLRAYYLNSGVDVTRFTQFANGFWQEAADGSINKVETMQFFSHYNKATNSNQLAQLDVDWKIKKDGYNADLIAGASYSESDWRNAVLQNRSRANVNIFNRNAATYDLGSFPKDYIFIRDELTSGAQQAAWAIARLEMLNERLTVFGGIRKETRLEAKLTTYNSTGVATSVKSSDDVDLVNSQIGATFAFNDKVTGYYSYTQSGSFNTNFPDDPQRGTGLDVGFRMNLLNRKISASIAYFDIELENIERIDFNSIARTPLLSGKERSQGWEFELIAYPAPGLTAIFNYSSQDPRVVSNSEAPFTEGSTPDAAFKKSANGYLRYELTRGSLKGLYFGSGFNYRSEVRPFGGNAALYLLTNPAYTVWSVQGGYAWATKKAKWSFDLSVKNALDEYYIENTAIKGEGRKIIASVGVRF